MVASANTGSSYPSLTRGVIPSLDGWRAVCIALVLLDHTRWAVGGAGWSTEGLGGLGVRFFFIISGFLITTLMLREEARQGIIDVPAFFKRRCLRILPVYYVFLLVVLILQIATPYQLPFREWMHCLTFTKNYSGDEWTTGHLWSLAVEQQFYILWPFVFQALRPNSSPIRALRWLGVPLLLCPILYAASVVFDIKGVLGWRSFLINADSLAIGCSLAIVLWHWGSRIGAFMEKRGYLILTAGLIFSTLPLWLHLHGPLFPISFAFPALQNVGLVLLLSISVGAKSLTPLHCLKWRSVSFIGVISYSLYIWQSLFCSRPELFGAQSAWWNTAPSWMVAALFAAIASYYAIEKPFLKAKKRQAR
jgi:peptidoglycan/LPS O-acetylase OafA/YrhL